MKKRTRIAVLMMSMLLVISMAGCSLFREKPEEYLKNQLSEMKEGKSKAAEEILKGKTEGALIENFPEDAKTDYEAFITAALGQIKYEIGEVKKEGSSDYKTSITVSPLDLKSMLETPINECMETTKATELNAALKEVLAVSTEKLKNPQYADDVKMDLTLTWNKDHYTIKDSDYETLLDTLISDVMYPYTSVNDVFYMKQGMDAALNFIFQGNIEGYTKFFFVQEETAKAQYDEFFSQEIPDSDFSKAGEKEFMSSLKEIFKTVKYEVKMPKKTGEDSYTIDVVATPNTSLKTCMDTLEAKANKGAFSSMSQIEKALLKEMKAVIKKPTYGKEKTITVELSKEDILGQVDFENLLNTIIVAE